MGIELTTTIPVAAERSDGSNDWKIALGFQILWYISQIPNMVHRQVIHKLPTRVLRRWGNYFASVQQRSRVQQQQTLEFENVKEMQQYPDSFIHDRPPPLFNVIQMKSRTTFLTNWFITYVSKK
jgi:hypothetical protein